jgi:hypothetical protein
MAKEAMMEKIVIMVRFAQQANKKDRRLQPSSSLEEEPR